MAGYLSGNLIDISTFNLCDCEYFEDTRMPVETLKLLHWLRADACLTDTWRTCGVPIVQNLAGK